MSVDNHKKVYRHTNIFVKHTEMLFISCISIEIVPFILVWFIVNNNHII